MEAEAEILEASFAAAAGEPRCRGFAVGRSIFADAAAGWFANRIGDAAVIEQIADGYRALIAMWERTESAAAQAKAPSDTAKSTHTENEKGLVS